VAEGKKNCWEAKGCGREPGGARCEELGVCPAASEPSLDGVHGGTNAGRTCWAVAGTLCGGSIQGSFASKFGDCEKCEFYRSVRKEEWPRFKLLSSLMALLNRGKPQT
jgi:hypothetical protein